MDTPLSLLREIVGQDKPNRWGYDAAHVALDDDWRARARAVIRTEDPVNRFPCPHCGRKYAIPYDGGAGPCCAECPGMPTESFDMTPEALKTPEGAARANAAADKLNDAVASVAHTFNEIWDDIKQQRHQQISADWLIANMEDAMEAWHDAGAELHKAMRTPKVRA